MHHVVAAFCYQWTKLLIPVIVFFPITVKVDFIYILRILALSAFMSHSVYSLCKFEAFSLTHIFISCGSLYIKYTDCFVNHRLPVYFL